MGRGKLIGDLKMKMQPLADSPSRCHPGDQLKALRLLGMELRLEILYPKGQSKTQTTALLGQQAALPLGEKACALLEQLQVVVASGDTREAKMAAFEDQIRILKWLRDNPSPSTDSSLSEWVSQLLQLVCLPLLHGLKDERREGKRAALSPASVSWLTIAAPAMAMKVVLEAVNALRKQAFDRSKKKAEDGEAYSTMADLQAATEIYLALSEGMLELIGSLAKVALTASQDGTMPAATAPVSHPPAAPVAAGGTASLSPVHSLVRRQAPAALLTAALAVVGARPHPAAPTHKVELRGWMPRGEDNDEMQLGKFCSFLARQVFFIG